MAGNSSPQDDPFANIVDDVEARNEAKSWAYDALREGRPPEWVEAQLVTNGWSRDDAAAMAEEARKKTRHVRGVVTRDDVSRAAEVAYRQGSQPTFAHGVIDQPQEFLPDTPAGPVNETPQPTPGTLGYEVRDRRHERRLAMSRWRAIVTIVIGSFLLLLGVVLMLAFAASSDGMGLREFTISGALVVTGSLIVFRGVFEIRSPTRLVSRADRGLLDRRDHLDR